VDACSVWRGPAGHRQHHASVFSVFSFTFPVPGPHLGLPDLFFFALPGAAQRAGLRVVWTWLALCPFNRDGAREQNVNGLPALPLLPSASCSNADLLWHRPAAFRHIVD
jgi:hypothetical protein